MSNAHPKTSAIIVAAGSGVRFGQDKLMLKLGEQTVLEKSVAAFLQPFIEEVMVVCNPARLVAYQKLIEQKFKNDPRLKFIAGGSERWQSSHLGITAASGEIVAIHDAARPLIRPELIEQTIKLAASHGAALCAAGATDSIKLVNEQAENYDALDRKTIWLAQTPQTFRRELILSAYQKALQQNYQNMTDESELVTRFLKQTVKIVPSDSRNLKITFPIDLQMAQVILSTQS